MTLSVDKRVSVGLGNGATTVWPYDFMVFDATHFSVEIVDADLNRTLVDPGDYTLTGVGTGEGTVTYPLVGSPLPSGSQIVLRRTVPYTQDLAITNQGGFQPRVLEDQLDRIVMQTQQLGEESSRSVKTKSGVEGPSLIGPAEEGKTLAWASGNRLVNAPMSEAEIAADVQAAKDARDKSRQWANELPDVVVDHGEFSGRHYANLTKLDRAQTTADRIQTAADRAQTSTDASQTAADRVQTGLDVIATDATLTAVQLAAQASAAFTNTTIAAAIAAGLAGTTADDTFSATGDDVDYVGLYVHETGPVATEIARYPKVEAVDALAASTEQLAINNFVRNRKWPVTPAWGSIADPAFQPQELTITRTGQLRQLNAAGDFEDVPVNQLGHDHDPITGAYLGWRLEHTATNLFQHNTDLENAWWTKVGVSATADEILTWRGVPLYKFEQTDATGMHGVERQGQTVASGQSYLVSGFVKPGEVEKGAIVWHQAGFAALRSVKFDLVNGTMISSDTDITHTGTEYLGNGVWWIWARAVATASATTAMSVGIFALNDDDELDFAGTEGDGFYVGELCMENFSVFPGSRIPAAGAILSRGQTTIKTDEVTLPEGAFYIEFTPMWKETVSRRIASFFGDSNNRIHVIHNTNGVVNVGGNINGAAFSLSGSVQNTPRVPMRIAVSWRKGRQIFAINGKVYDRGSVDQPFVGVGRLVVGQDWNASNSQNAGWMKAALLFNRPLGLAEITQMTAPDGYDPGKSLENVDPWVGIPTHNSVRIIADFPTARADVVATVSRTELTQQSGLNRNDGGNTAMTFNSAATATVTRDMIGGERGKVHTVDITVEGLPDPDYPYFIRLTSQGRSTPWIPFKTAAAPGASGSHSSVIVSCTELQGLGDFPLGKAIADQTPDFGVHLGDMAYVAPISDNVPLYRRTIHRHFAQTPVFKDMLSRVPFTHVPHNHDGVEYGAEGVNDINGTFGSTGKTWSEVYTATRTAWAERVPYSELLSALLTAQKFTQGRVRYLLLDTIGQRDLTVPTLLGDAGSAYDQKQRFKDELEQAGVDDMMQVVVLTPDSITMGLWSSAVSAEIEEMLDFAAETTDVPACLWVCGDPHHMSRDDGTFSAAHTTNDSRMPIVTTSALKSQSHYYYNNDTWRGARGNFPARDHQWLNLAFHDEGGFDFHWRAQFFGGPFHRDTPTKFADFSSRDVTPEIGFESDTAAVATNAAIELAIDRTWFSVAGGSGCRWTDDRSNTGMIDLRPNQNKAVLSIPPMATPGTIVVTLSDPYRATIGSQAVCTVTVS